MLVAQISSIFIILGLFAQGQAFQKKIIKKLYYYVCTVLLNTK